jgi:hypothetical protein
MEAEIFCLNRDLAAAEMLGELLSAKLGESITLTVHNLEEGTSWERDPLALRYTQLLQASIPPDSRISVSVTAMDWYTNRVYVRVYWPMHVAGTWEEMAGTTVFFEDYTVWRKIHCQSSPQHGSELFFPALALRNRMVLVPMGQETLLTQIGMAPPDFDDGVLSRDVLEVDFSDHNAIEAAVTTLSQQLIAEIRREVIGYMAVHPGAVVDATFLSAELGVGSDLFVLSMKEEASVYEMLSFGLAERRFIQGRWTKTRLLIRNDSPSNIPQVRIKIEGPVKVEPAEIRLEIPPHSEVVQDISIQAADLGEFPLKIAVSLPHHEVLAPAFADWLPPPTYIWLETRSASGQGSPGDS